MFWTYLLFFCTCIGAASLFMGLLITAYALRDMWLEHRARREYERELAAAERELDRGVPVGWLDVDVPWDMTDRRAAS